MSKNKNNRPKEIRSLKGPSRKLELIVEDGKRYICLLYTSDAADD